MVTDLALQRSKYKHLSDEEWRWFLQQVEGRERTADKLPTFAAIDDWWYPVRLSCEQCSSELTARYKASLLSPLALGEGKGERFLDLTGGYGVDTFFLSEHFAHTDYVEQNAELCRIAAHNFALIQKSKDKSSPLQSTTVLRRISCSPPPVGRPGGVLSSSTPPAATAMAARSSS